MRNSANKANQPPKRPNQKKKEEAQKDVGVSSSPTNSNSNSSRSSSKSQSHGLRDVPHVIRITVKSVTGVTRNHNNNHHNQETKETNKRRSRKPKKSSVPAAAAVPPVPSELRAFVALRSGGGTATISNGLQHTINPFSTSTTRGCDEFEFEVPNTLDDTHYSAHWPSHSSNCKEAMVVESNISQSVEVLVGITPTTDTSFGIPLGTASIPLSTLGRKTYSQHDYELPIASIASPSSSIPLVSTNNNTTINNTTTKSPKPTRRKKRYGFFPNKTKTTTVTKVDPVLSTAYRLQQGTVQVMVQVYEKHTYRSTLRLQQPSQQQLRLSRGSYQTAFYELNRSLTPDIALADQNDDDDDDSTMEEPCEYPLDDSLSTYTVSFDDDDSTDGDDEDESSTEREDSFATLSTDYTKETVTTTTVGNSTFTSCSVIDEDTNDISNNTTLSSCGGADSNGDETVLVNGLSAIHSTDDDSTESDESHDSEEDSNSTTETMSERVVIPSNFGSQQFFDWGRLGFRSTSNSSSGEKKSTTPTKPTLQGSMESPHGVDELPLDPSTSKSGLKQTLLDAISCQGPTRSFRAKYHTDPIEMAILSARSLLSMDEDDRPTTTATATRKH